MEALHGQLLLTKTTPPTLSSRPERSEVEGPAVLVGSHQTFKGGRALNG